MVAAVYTRLAATALRLITKYGRDVTLKFATDTSPPDADQPWEPGAPSYVTKVVKGVIFPIDEKYVDGTTVLATDEQALVAAKNLPAVPDPKTVLLDGTTPYKTVKVDPIGPGDIALVYTLIVRR